MSDEIARCIARACALSAPPGWAAVFGLGVDVEWALALRGVRRSAFFDECATEDTAKRFGTISGDLYSYPCDGSEIEPPFAPTALLISLDPRWGRVYRMLARWTPAVVEGGMIVFPAPDAATQAMIAYWRFADPGGPSQSGVAWDDAVDGVGGCFALRRAAR